MKRLRVIDFGTKCQGVRLHGSPENPEPEYFRVALPFGDLVVSRVNTETAPEYWVHLRVNRPGDGGDHEEARRLGRIADARLDLQGSHASDSLAEPLRDPNLHHLAVRLKEDPR